LKKIVSKFGVILLLSLLALLTACGEKESFNVPLQNQDGQEVVLPINNKPTVIFFFTTYT
jgi:uncharacterized lipoprotein YehR (DUF1307 family)